MQICFRPYEFSVKHCVMNFEVMVGRRLPPPEATGFNGFVSWRGFDLVVMNVLWPHPCIVSHSTYMFLVNSYTFVICVVHI